ncbi:MrfB [Lelliottia jeotgali]|nr:MrfB [Lelliottia jeotgali]
MLRKDIYLWSGIFAGIILFFCGNTWASQGARGRVSMQGSIIDTACAIDTGSLYQSIEMPPLPIAQILRDGRGPEVPFSIRLINCTLQHQNPALPDWYAFQVTFDGSTTSRGLFGIQGQARGIGLQIADAFGEIAEPGNPMNMHILEAGATEMKYTLRLEGNHEHLHAGDYSSIIRFKLDYF